LSNLKKGTGKYEYHLTYNFFYEKLPQVQNIKFLTIEKNKRNFISGFIITVENSTKNDAEKTAETLSTNLTYLLSISASRFSECHMRNSSFQEYGSKVKQMTTSLISKGDILLDVEIDENDIQKLESDPQFRQQIARIYTAIRELVSDNNEGAIKELYSCIEYNFPSSLSKYKYLRHCLTHDPPNAETRRNLENEYGVDYFKFNSEGQFDYNSPSNQERVAHESWDFLKEVRKIVLGRDD